MNRDQSGAHPHPNAFHDIQHRPIGLRAVAAAILYHGNSEERAASRELSPPPVAVTPPSDHEH
jgi:hypothetical protein